MATTGQGSRAAGDVIPRRLRWRHRIVRIVAIAAALVAVADIAASIYAYRQVDRGERAARMQFQQISDTFAQISTTLRTVSNSATDAATSVDQAQTSLTSTSSTLRDAASTLDATAGVINFQIPITNLRPLAGVDDNFRAQANQLRSLSDQVDTTRDSLGKNATDLRAIAAEVTTVSGQMDSVARQLRQFAGSGPGSGILSQITAGTRIVIAWTVVMHLLLLGMAASLYILTIEHGAI